MKLMWERVSGEMWMPPWLRFQHVARYQWASALVHGRRVVDAACGTGYGARIMIEAGAACVAGFDLSPEAIREATQAGRATGGPRFAVADATRLPVPDRSFDAYVSFETIEHLPDDRAFLAEVVRVLAPGGRFICSTPNRTFTHPGPSATLASRPFNPFHAREYSIDEFESLLRLYFRKVELFGQTWYRFLPLGLLGAVGRVSPLLAVRLLQVRKVLGVPFDRFARHLPEAGPPIAKAEFAIAVCTL